MPLAARGSSADGAEAAGVQHLGRPQQRLSCPRTAHAHSEVDDGEELPLRIEEDVLQR